MKESGGRFVLTTSLEELVGALERPRKIMMMIKAGPPVDGVLEQLKPLLEQGDIVIDGGNSWCEDTRRREKDYAAAGLSFFGVGVSGVKRGLGTAPRSCRVATAKPTGPLPPSSSRSRPRRRGSVRHSRRPRWRRPLRQDGAQGKFPARHWEPWRPPTTGAAADLHRMEPRHPRIVPHRDHGSDLRRPRRGGRAPDRRSLDKAGQKGTGRWTARVAIDHGVPIPSIAVAIDARVLSSRKAERVAASEVLSGPPSTAYEAISRSWSPWSTTPSTPPRS